MRSRAKRRAAVAGPVVEAAIDVEADGAERHGEGPCQHGVGEGEERVDRIGRRAPVAPVEPERRQRGRASGVVGGGRGRSRRRRRGRPLASGAHSVRPERGREVLGGGGRGCPLAGGANTVSGTCRGRPGVAAWASTVLGFRGHGRRRHGRCLPSGLMCCALRMAAHPRRRHGRRRGCPEQLGEGTEVDRGRFAFESEQGVGVACVARPIGESPQDLEQQLTLVLVSTPVAPHHRTGVAHLGGDQRACDGERDGGREAGAVLCLAQLHVLVAEAPPCGRETSRRSCAR